MPVDSVYYRDLLRRRFEGRKVILADGMVAGSGARLERLRDLATQTPFLLAEGIGTGEMPEAHELEWHVLGRAETASLMEGIRLYLEQLGDLPPGAAAAIERYDPAGEALVIPALFGIHREIAGRPVYGARPGEWIALEDKIAVEALWDRAGVPRAESRIVPVEREALLRAAAEVDRGAGTVWSADNREGWHGGAHGVRYVQGGRDVDDALSFFAQAAHRVRVMPFLEGIPCNIHGIVFEDDVVVLRPVEGVTLRRPGESTFRYCGCATFWDPAPDDRETMRDVARRVGAHLRAVVGYRGTFTIDGVMTAEGFRPTELNPRFGAGIGTMSRALPDLPIYLVHLAIVAGEPWDFRPRDLERLILDGADAMRAGGAYTWDPLPRDETTTCEVVEDPAGVYRIASAVETPDAVIMIGPSTLGCMVRLVLDPDRHPPGPSVAPRAVAAFEFADRTFGTSLGPLEPARAVR